MQIGDPTLWRRDEAPKSFYSPLSKDLKLTYRNDDSSYQDYILPALDISTHPAYLADWMMKHLVDEIINSRKLGFVTPEERVKIEEEIQR